MDIRDKITIGKMEMPNRIVRSATNDYRGNEDGTVSDEQLDIYGELAGSGVGLIITGNFYVSDKGRIDECQNGLDSAEKRKRDFRVRL